MSLHNENPEDNEQSAITPEEYLRESKSSIRKKSLWSIGLGAAAVFISIAAVLAVTTFPEYFPKAEDASSDPVFSMLFRNMIFLLGLFFVFAGLWGLYEARRLTLEDIIPTQEAIDFINEGRETVPYYSYILVGSIIAVFIAQMVADANNARDFPQPSFSVEIAGLVKPLVWEGEYWRLLTGAALHGSFLHIYFNGQAFYGFGTTIEYLSNRAHLAIVFVLAALGGSLLSLLAMPEGTSVGASGGIMGLVGYLAIYGFLQVPRNLEVNPRRVSAVAEFFGMIAMGVFVFTSVLSILLILEIIKF